MLAYFKARGLVKAEGRARTDSTHVLAAIHRLDRLEVVGQTLQAALEGLAQTVPARLTSQVTPDGFDWYSRRIDEYRLPKKDSERQVLAEPMGRDGQHSLTQLETLSNRAVSDSAAVQPLRQVWQQQ